MIQAPGLSTYLCPICGHYFERGMLACLVMHREGDCCHHGDRAQPELDESDEAAEAGDV